MGRGDMYEQIDQVCLSDEGTFKYILIHVVYDDCVVEFVRGYVDVGHHYKILNRFINEFDGKKITVDEDC